MDLVSSQIPRPLGYLQPWIGVMQIPGLYHLAGLLLLVRGGLCLDLGHDLLLVIYQHQGLLGLRIL